VQIAYGADFNSLPAPSLRKVILNDEANVNFEEEIFEKYNFACKYCYFSHADDIVFTLPPEYINPLSQSGDFFLACRMSDWGNANKSNQWKLQEISIDGHSLLGLKIPRNDLRESFPFKFISADEEWCSPDDTTPNCQLSSIGTMNFLFNPNVTGDNILQYHLQSKISLESKLVAVFSDDSSISIDFSPWIASLRCNIQLGSVISGDSTIFRIFAPRATNARVAIIGKKEKYYTYYPLLPSSDGIWHTEIYKNLHGYYYYYQLLFSKNGNWSEAVQILDPYAQAAVCSKGPGIILDPNKLGRGKDKFITPDAKDLIILEMHLRDVVKNMPRLIPYGEKLYFSDLRKYLKKKDCYLRDLGINCVELQPIQEFDYSKKEEYQWGYMPANWFSPSSAYSKNPQRAAQAKEFQNLVKGFHKAGIAVILDVVYNHFGIAGHLQNIDSRYYFRHEKNGNFTNFSGCGNDFRTESYMARKMIVDSLEHLIKTYNVDGFRFDLAELLGIDFLSFLQKKLKSVKKTIVLVAEPWSFRGNIGVSMRKLSYSVWNDEYRNFARDYVLGNGNSDGLRYFLCGGLDFRSAFPCQSVNYVASHDDRGWVDSITENPHNDGSAPTENDCRRTRLSAAILMMSVGIPMITAGQDFLASKQGVSNTYNRGDLNALDYKLLEKNSRTHEYFKELIKFRLSKAGEILRPGETPNKSYFQFFSSSTNSACALVYNADCSFSGNKLIFAVNPHSEESAINFRNFNPHPCNILANEDKFFTFPRKFYDKFDGGKLLLPPLSCRIYTMK
jgi:pullulanase/glycogen debranching enzyme